MRAQNKRSGRSERRSSDRVAAGEAIDATSAQTTPSAERRKRRVGVLECQLCAKRTARTVNVMTGLLPSGV